MRVLSTLRYIEIISQEGSIRRAADRLAITSTALNRRVLALEEELGYPLFERLPSGVRLNTAGEIFVDFVRRQFSDFERVKSQISELADMQNPVTQVTPVNRNGLEPLPQRSRYRNGKGNSLLINKVMANKTETVGLGDDIEGQGMRQQR